MTQEDREFFDKVTDNSLDKGLGLDYNLFCCEQAILISDALQTKENILDFTKKGWDDQIKLVPGLSTEHSGNTFGMSCRFALSYLPVTHAKIRDGKLNQLLG